MPISPDNLRKFSSDELNIIQSIKKKINSSIDEYVDEDYAKISILTSDCKYRKGLTEKIPRTVVADYKKNGWESDYRESENTGDEGYVINISYPNKKVPFTKAEKKVVKKMTNEIDSFLLGNDIKSDFPLNFPEVPNTGEKYFQTRRMCEKITDLYIKAGWNAKSQVMANSTYERDSNNRYYIRFIGKKK